MVFTILLLGFFFLIKGADIFVEGSSSIARKFNVPPMVIGLTIVAMGTSAPEAAVSITSSIAGQNDMALANVVGSNFFNILIVLGVSCIISTLPVEKNTIKKDTPFLLFVSGLLLIFSIDLNISRIEGFIFLAIFTYFLIDTVKTAKNSDSKVEDVPSEDSPMFKTILLCILGIIGIVLGGDMVVKSASSIAKSLGMSDNLVGLTIVAIGTSLPEFVTSVVAVRKGENDIAIGNIIGSNIFNILFVLGLSTFINPISISMFALFDVIFMILITILLFIFIKSKNSLIKSQGFIFIGLYIAYMTYTIIR